MSAQILDSLTQLDQAISTRINIEMQFIARMVQEFGRIKQQLDECNERHPGPQSTDLSQISERLGNAIHDLKTKPPLHTDQAMQEAVQKVLRPNDTDADDTDDYHESSSLPDSTPGDGPPSGDGPPPGSPPSGTDGSQIDLSQVPSDTRIIGQGTGSSPVPRSPWSYRANQDQLGGWRTKRTRRRRNRTKRTKRTKPH